MRPHQRKTEVIRSDGNTGCFFTQLKSAACEGHWLPDGQTTEVWFLPCAGRPSRHLSLLCMVFSLPVNKAEISCITTHFGKFTLATIYRRLLYYYIFFVFTCSSSSLIRVACLARTVYSICLICFTFGLISCSTDISVCLEPRSDLTDDCSELSCVLLVNLLKVQSQTPDHTNQKGRQDKHGRNMVICALLTDFTFENIFSWEFAVLYYWLTIFRMDDSNPLIINFLVQVKYCIFSRTMSFTYIHVI